MRVERVVYGVPNLEECVRFFTDFGLDPLDGDGAGARFATQTGQVVELRNAGDPTLPPAVQDGPTLREIVWGVDTQESLDKLAHLVDNLLDMSRLQAGALSLFPRPAGLEEIVSSALDNLDPAGRGITVDIPESLPAIAAAMLRSTLSMRSA